MAHKPKTNHPIVVVERDWKEYIGECFLIIFSVVLALAVTELINNINEKKKTNEILHQLKDELIVNKKNEEEQYQYHLQVIKNITTAINNPALAKQFINDSGKISLDVIAPDGVLRHDLVDVAWQIAKQNNIISKIDIDTYIMLNDIYNNQQRITSSEDKIALILLSFESRKPENLMRTLYLLRDSFYGWDVNRAPGLIKQYGHAIDRLKSY